MTAKISNAPTKAGQHLSSSLAERLRDGPLHALVALYFKAMALSNEIETGQGDHVRQLADLVQLTDTATARFQEFAADLKKIIDELAAEQRERLGQ